MFAKGLEMEVHEAELPGVTFDSHHDYSSVGGMV